MKIFCLFVYKVRLNLLNGVVMRYQYVWVILFKLFIFLGVEFNRVFNSKIMFYDCKILLDIFYVEIFINQGFLCVDEIIINILFERD